jgi:hypothetical protein
MKREDAARLLAAAALSDNRTFNEGQIVRWANLLGTLDPIDCLTAIELHYRDTDTPVTPARIRWLITRMMRERQEADRSRKLFEPYDADLNPTGLPEYNAHLNRYGKALVMAAAREASEVRAAKTLKKSRPNTPIGDALARSEQQPGKWTVFDLVHELEIEVPELTGTEVADTIHQMALPLEESGDDRRLRLARERARADKAARTGRAPL